MTTNIATVTEETTITTTATESAPVMKVSLRSDGAFPLPSQAGKAGRPRARGRAYVRPSVAGEALNRQAIQAVLACRYGLRPNQVLPYAHDSNEGVLAFIIPGLDKDTGECFLATTSEG